VHGPHPASRIDDIEFAGIASPPLTTIRQPLHEMGATAAELLIRRIANDESVKSVRIRPELIVRSSAGPPPFASSKGTGQSAFKSPR
jgi:DNA-binding LacI/PurR family transcriptional regulator